MNPLAISPEIVNQIVDAVFQQGPAIWAAGSAAAATAAETLSNGALSKLGDELVGGLLSRLRGKSKDAPKDRAEVERAVREVLQSDPAFAQQVQIRFEGPVQQQFTSGGTPIQVQGPAYFNLPESGPAPSGAAAAPARAPESRALLYLGIAEPLVEEYRSWLVAAPEHENPEERATFLEAFPLKEIGAYGIQFQKGGGRILAVYQTPQKVPSDKVVRLVEEWAGEAPKELQSGSRPIPGLDSRLFEGQLRQGLRNEPVQVISL